MTLDIRFLKVRAKGLIAASKPKILGVSLAFVLLTLLFTMLGNRVLGVNISENDVENYYMYFQNGDFEHTMQLFERMMPPKSAYLIDLLLRMVMAIVGVGFTMYCMNVSRQAEAVMGNLMDGFGFALKIIVVFILECVLIALWSCLLIIPGFIASYRYRMAIYILIDDTSLSPLECIRRSKAMMKGHKAELLGLDLSFIGWIILNMMPMVGYAVMISSLPYMQITRALYYDGLKGAYDRTDENDQRYN